MKELSLVNKRFNEIIDIYEYYYLNINKFYDFNFSNLFNVGSLKDYVLNYKLNFENFTEDKLELICKYQKLSLEFTESNIDIFSEKQLNHICKYQTLSLESI